MGGGSSSVRGGKKGSRAAGQPQEAQEGCGLGRAGDIHVTFLTRQRLTAHTAGSAAREQCARIAAGGLREGCRTGDGSSDCRRRARGWGGIFPVGG